MSLHAEKAQRWSIISLLKLIYIITVVIQIKIRVNVLIKHSQLATYIVGNFSIYLVPSYDQ